MEKLGISLTEENTDQFKKVFAEGFVSGYDCGSRTAQFIFTQPIEKVNEYMRTLGIEPKTIEFSPEPTTFSRMYEYVRSKFRFLRLHDSK